MIDPWNRVNGNIQTVVKKTYSTCSFTTSKLDTPSSFPCVCVEQVDLVSDTDLLGNECVVKSVIEIKTYSNKSDTGITETRAIAALCADAMATMGYIRKYGPRIIENEGALNIKSTIARYERVLGDKNDIEKMT